MLNTGFSNNAFKVVKDAAVTDFLVILRKFYLQYSDKLYYEFFNNSNYQFHS